MTPSPAGESGLLRPTAHLTLFGFEPTRASLELQPRSRRWRLARALRVLAVTLVVAPLVGLVPPHAPWVLGVLAGGLFLARRAWSHRFSVVALEARCPRCGAELSLSAGSRLRAPHPIPCEACHHQPALEIPPEELPTA